MPWRAAGESGTVPLFLAPAAQIPLQTTGGRHQTVNNEGEIIGDFLSI